MSGGVSGKESSGPHELLGELETNSKVSMTSSSSDWACRWLGEVLGHNGNSYAATASVKDSKVV